MNKTFSVNGTLTEDGEKLKAFIEGMIDATGGEVGGLNGLPGTAKGYFNMVLATKVVTPAQFMEDYASQCQVLSQQMEMAEAKVAESKKAAETSEAVTELTDKLTKFQESVAAQVKELEDRLAAKDAEIEALKTASPPAKKKGKGDKTETEGGDSNEGE